MVILEYRASPCRRLDECNFSPHFWGTFLYDGVLLNKLRRKKANVVLSIITVVVNLKSKLG
jgi:hypothetical protein